MTALNHDSAVTAVQVASHPIYTRWKIALDEIDWADPVSIPDTIEASVPDLSTLPDLVARVVRAEFMHSRGYASALAMNA